MCYVFYVHKSLFCKLTVPKNFINLRVPGFFAQRFICEWKPLTFMFVTETSVIYPFAKESGTYGFGIF